MKIKIRVGEKISLGKSKPEAKNFLLPTEKNF